MYGKGLNLSLCVFSLCRNIYFLRIVVSVLCYKDVPEGDFMIPLGKAEVMRKGTDITLLGWGAQMRVLEKVCV